MSVEEKLARINVKVERANKHILELQEAVKSFRDSHPYELRANYDPTTGQMVSATVVRAEKIPDPISAIIGDAIQNLRSALDHLGHQLWLMVPGADAGVNVDFHFWNKPSDFNGGVHLNESGRPYKASGSQFQN